MTIFKLVFLYKIRIFAILRENPITRDTMSMFKSFIFIYGLYLTVSFSNASADVFDMMDKQDFNEQIDNAKNCAAKYDFVCADNSLKEAKKFVNDKRESLKLSSARDYVASKKLAYDAEKKKLEDEKQKREVEARRVREAEERKESLSRQKAEYDAVINKWSGNQIVVTFSSRNPGWCLSDIKSAMKVQDPIGVLNPYWIPKIVDSATYDDYGVVVGEWYMPNFKGYDNWQRQFKQEMKRIRCIDEYSYEMATAVAYKRHQEDRERRAVGFRNNLRVGDSSSEGTIIEINRPMAKVQTSQAITHKYTRWEDGQYGKVPKEATETNYIPVEKWLRIDELYPK